MNIIITKSLNCLSKFVSVGIQIVEFANIFCLFLDRRV